jgi:CheY-like chemotaxis protein
MSRDFSLFNAMNFPVCVINTSGELDFYNSLFKDTVLGKDESASLDFSHPFFPEYRKRVALAYQKAREGEGGRCFAVIRSASNEQIPVEIYLYPLQEEDAKFSIIAFFISVDNRLTSFDDPVVTGGQTTLDHANLFEFSPFPLIRIDKDYNIVALSTSTEELCGIPREEILEEPTRLFGTLLPFDLERIKKSVADILNGTSTFRRVNDIKITTAKKEDKWANAVIYPVYKEKKKILAEVILENITKIKNLENKVSALNRVQIIGDLTKGLLHSFNNSTNVIINRAQMLMQITEKQTVLDGIAIIHKAASDSARQIRRVQDFISDSGAQQEETAADIIEIIEDAIEFTRIHFKVERKEKGRIVTISKQFFAKERVSGHIKTLREIMISMIFRTASFIEKQGSIETDLRFDDDLIFTCSASVPASAASGRASHGTTLPEIEIRRIAEKIHVRIFEEVSQDRYTIRAVIPHSMIIGPEKNTTQAETGRLRDYDILVVEDEEALQEILFEIFDSTGNRVSVCSNGNDALNEFKHNKYNVVIADYGLPGMTGLELLKKVRELNEKTATVLLSGWMIEDMKKYSNTVDLFLSKPFQLDSLIREIARVVKKDS